MPVTRKLSDILSGPYNRLKGFSGFDLVDPMILSGRMLFGERGSLPSPMGAPSPSAPSSMVKSLGAGASKDISPFRASAQGVGVVKPTVPNVTPANPAATAGTITPAPVPTGGNVGRYLAEDMNEVAVTPTVDYGESMARATTPVADAKKSMDMSTMAFILGKAGQAIMGPYQDSWQAQLGGVGAGLAQASAFKHVTAEVLAGKDLKDIPSAGILAPEQLTQVMAMQADKTKLDMAKTDLELKKLDIENTKADREADRAQKAKEHADTMELEYAQLQAMIDSDEAKNVVSKETANNTRMYYSYLIKKANEDESYRNEVKKFNDAYKRAKAMVDANPALDFEAEFSKIFGQDISNVPTEQTEEPEDELSKYLPK